MKATGDTLFVDRWHTYYRWRDRYIHDTIIDTVYNNVVEKVVVEAPRKGGFAWGIVALLLFILVLILTITLIKNKLKIK